MKKPEPGDLARIRAAVAVADAGGPGEVEAARQREMDRIRREVDQEAGRLDPCAMAALDMRVKHGWTLGPALRQRALAAGRRAFAAIVARAGPGQG